MTENGTDNPPKEDESRAQDVFALLGNERRLEIIWTLGDAYVYGEPNRLSFSTLRSRTDTDDPGNLHYHLAKLEGYFIEDTESGYRLRSEGIKLYGILRAGIFSPTRESGKTSVPAGFDCHYCGAGVEAKIGTFRVNIQCPDCEYIYVRGLNELPLDQFEDEQAMLAHFSNYHPYKHFWFARGVCTTCGRSVGSEFQDPGAMGVSMAQRRDKVLIDRSCSYCGTQNYLTVGTAVLADTGVISFCHEHGLDVISTPFWELPFVWSDDYVTVLSTDPWRVAVRITLDGETLEVVVDDDLTILERTLPAASVADASSVVRESESGTSGPSGPGKTGGPGKTAGRRTEDGPERAKRTFGHDETGSEDSVNLPSTADCLEALRRRRWPDGVTCPHCNSSDNVKIGSTSKDAQRYRCKSCDTIFNDLTGTIFAERRLTLPEMYYIVREMDVTTIAEIARQLDRHYTSVLDFVHVVQEAEETTGERFPLGLQT